MTVVPSVVVLVATRFRPDPLTRLLASLAGQSVRPLAAVICDNGPDPATVEVAKKSPLPCELASPGKNLGFGGGLAAAAQRAFARFPEISHFLVVDDDAILAPKDLETLLTSANKHSAGTVAPFLVDEPGKLQEVPEPVSWSLARAFRAAGQNLDKARALAPGGYPMAWCIGPCLLIEKGAWLRAGPPRSDMLAFGDDIEFSLRLSAASPAWAEPSVTVIHAPPKPSESPSASGRPSYRGADNLDGRGQVYGGQAPPESTRLGAKEGPPAQSHPSPVTRHPPPENAHYRKFGILLQNLAFTCVASPRPRHLPLYLPGNAKRFLRTLGFTPSNFLEVARRYIKGFLGIPGGK